MTRSFKNPNGRIPNFGVAGAMPNPRPWWADIDHCKVDPPASPPWSPPSPPQDTPDPFGVPPQMPAPLPPRSDKGQASTASGLLDRLFGYRRADRDWSARRLPPAAGIDAPQDLVDRRQWELIEPKLDLEPLPFNSRQMDMLLQLRPDELLRLTGDKPSRGRAVQPPIFFPFD